MEKLDRVRKMRVYLSKSKNELIANRNDDDNNNKYISYQKDIHCNVYGSYIKSESKMGRFCAENW